MKKSLFLLPLLAGLALCGCGNQGGGGGGGGGGDQPSGQSLGLVTMTKCADMGDPGVFSKGAVTVKVTQGECAQTIDEAVSATGNYEFKVYAKMDVEFSCTSNFSKFVVKYSTYSPDGKKTYYFDYSLDDADNNFDNTKGEATVTLNSAAKSYTVNCWHQTRIASVEFFA